MTTNEFTDTEYVGVTTLGQFLGTTDTWGRQLAERKDFPAPALRIRTPVRTVAYWRSDDVREFGRKYAEHRAMVKAGVVLDEILETQADQGYQPTRAPEPEPEPKPKKKRLSRPELRALKEERERRERLPA